MEQSDIKKILLVLPNWIGDAVMSLPAVYSLRDKFPFATITIIGLPHISELFYESPYVDEIMRYKKNPPFSPLSLRSGNYDLALLLPNSFSSALLVRLAGIPNRCGYSRDARGFLLTMPIRLKPEIKRLHQVEYYHYLVRSFDENQGGHFPHFPAGNMGSIPKSYLFLSKAEIQQAREILAKYKITPDDLLIGINPGAAYGSSKRWHPERFGQVAATLVRKYHAKVILFGGPGERDIAEEIVRASGASLLNMAGQTTIRGLMALLNQCRLLITNDSGPMHIAAALGVSVVAIFGPTDPTITAPVGSGHVVIKKDVPCSPCFRRECPTNLECMDLIKVDDVLGGVEEVLGQRSM